METTKTPTNASWKKVQIPSRFPAVPNRSAKLSPFRESVILTLSRYLIRSIQYRTSFLTNSEEGKNVFLNSAGSSPSPSPPSSAAVDVSNHPNTPPVDISIPRNSPSDDPGEDILNKGSPLHSPGDISSPRVADGLLRAEGILIRRRRGDGSGLWIDPPPVPP